jgi:hypothetical protein
MRKTAFIILLILTVFMGAIVHGNVKNQITNNNSPKQIPTANDKLTIEDFTINNGIKLGQTVKEVKKILGNPGKIKIEKSGGTATWTVYSYPTITIGFNNFDNTVDYYNFEKKGLRTFRGVEIGDSEEKVIQAYSDSTKWDNNCYVYQLSIYNPKEYVETVYSIAFYVDKDGQVDKVVVNFARD